MEYNQYLGTIRNKIGNNTFLNELNAELFYSEKFKLEWFATKMKQYSFVSNCDRITPNIIIDYSNKCTEYAIKNHKGFPPGFQNGIVSFNIIATNNIDSDAVSYVLREPKKRFSVFEFPIIYDLQNQRIYYFSGTPVVGYIYYNYFNEYILKNFTV